MRKYYYEFDGVDLARKYFADHASATHDAEETARIMLRQKMVQGNEIVVNVYCEENERIDKVESFTTIIVY